MLEDEQNCSHGGGGDARPLKIWSDFHPYSTVRMISTARFSVHILLLHHYGSDLAHISDFDSLVIGLSKSER